MTLREYQASFATATIVMGVLSVLMWLDIKLCKDDAVCWIFLGVLDGIALIYWLDFLWHIIVLV